MRVRLGPEHASGFPLPCLAFLLPSVSRCPTICRSSLSPFRPAGYPRACWAAPSQHVPPLHCQLSSLTWPSTDLLGSCLIRLRAGSTSLSSSCPCAATGRGGRGAAGCVTMRSVRKHNVQGRRCLERKAMLGTQVGRCCQTLLSPIACVSSFPPTLPTPWSRNWAQGLLCTRPAITTATSTRSFAEIAATPPSSAG